MENGHINHEAIVQHEFEKTFPRKDKKIKEANEMMIDAYDDGKAYYDNYKKLVSKVKNDYFSRSSENLKEDMQRLAPRVSYLSLITKDVIEFFNQKKRSRNILDFSDYEHFALKILNQQGFKIFGIYRIILGLYLLSIA